MFRRTVMIGFTWGFLSPTPHYSIDEPTQYLIMYGGTGGSGFTRTCGADKVMTGVTYREGFLVDAIGLLCRPVNANGTLGAQSTVGSSVGGGGGTQGSASCGGGKVVSGATITYGGQVKWMRILCGTWDPATRKFSGNEITPGFGYPSGPREGTATTNCSLARQPAVGIRGRAGAVIDAIGLICDEP